MRIKALYSSNLFLKYMISYFSLALLTCAVVGLSLFFFSSSEMNNALMQSQQERLEMAVNDLENQYQILTEISYVISTRVYYKSFFIQKSDLSKLRLIEDLARYRNYSPIIDDYFFYRKGDRLVYKTNAANEIDVYIKDVLHYDVQDNLIELLTDLNARAVYRLDATRMLFVFPMNIDTNPNLPSDALLGFVISRSKIKNRLNAISADLTRPIQIYHQGMLFYSDVLLGESNITTTNYTSTKSGMFLTARSAEGNFEAVMAFSEGSVNERLNNFRTISVVIIGLTILFATLIGVYFAMKNYRPIRDLMYKYGINTNHTGRRDEITTIDTALHSVIEKSQLAEYRMSEQNIVLESQKAILIQQFFMLILNGEYHHDIEMQIQALGIHFPEKYFCVYLLQVISPDLFDEEKVCRKINELSDKVTTFFCVRFKYNHSFAVVINTAMESLAEKAIDKICELGREMNMKFRLMRGKICKTLKSLPVSLASALLQGPETTLYTVDLNEGSLHNYTSVSQMLSLLKKNELYSALVKMEEFIALVKNESPLKINLKLIFAEVVISAMRLIHEITPELMIKAERVMECRNVVAFQSEFAGLLEQIHSHLLDQNLSSQKKIYGSIIAYIREHALDYDLSYDKLTEAFRLSAKSLRQIIYNETGKTLREYLNVLRINSAQELMRNGSATVTEISRRVGYTNASYFIKVFKDLIGTTPALYMKNILYEKNTQLNTPRNS